MNLTGNTGIFSIMTAAQIVQLLAKKRFVFSTEKDVQVDIEKVLKEAGVEHKREVILDDKNTIDFMVGPEGPVGMEVKIKGVKAGIYKQLERYAKFDSISELILITSKSMGIPSTINGKPVYVINMSKAWL